MEDLAFEVERDYRDSVIDTKRAVAREEKLKVVRKNIGRK